VGTLSDPKPVKFMLTRAVGLKDLRTSGTILAWENACVTFVRDDDAFCAKAEDNAHAKRRKCSIIIYKSG
jgi:hypothetical protein